jgi:hypothetical protein
MGMPNQIQSMIMSDFGFRLHKIVTLETSLIDKKMGSISTADLSELKNKIKTILAKYL